MTPPTILVVEDNPSDVDLFRLAWEQRGHAGDLLPVCSLAEAERQLHPMADQQRLPDLILLDLNLPGGHGTDLLALLRQQDRLVPVVVLTSSINPRDRQRCSDLGALGYLSKAGTFSELLELVDQIAELLAVVACGSGLQDRVHTSPHPPR